MPDQPLNYRRLPVTITLVDACCLDSSYDSMIVERINDFRAPRNILIILNIERLFVTSHSGKTPTVLVISVLTVVVFILDAIAPLGIAAGFFYILPVAAASWMPTRRHAVILAVASAMLAIVGFFVSPEGATGIAVINRSLTILTIWVTAIISVTLQGYRTKLAEFTIPESAPRLKLTDANHQFRGSESVLIVIVGVCTLAGLCLQAVDWEGSRELHSIMETVAALLAMLGGFLCLIRYYSRHSLTHLYVGTGLIGTGILDSLHGLVTSNFFAPLAASAPDSLIPWSWNASRIFLSVVLLSTVTVKRKPVATEQRKAHEHAIYFGVMTLTVLWIAFFGFVPLPTGYGAGILGRPAELISGAFFLAAAGCLIKRSTWKSDSFEYWLLASTLVAVVCQVLVMTQSFGLFDSMFNLAHLMKIFSYGLILVGTMQNIQILYRVADSTGRELELANTRFDLAVQGANDGLWDWHVQTDEVWYSPKFRELLGYDGEAVEEFPNVYSALGSRIHPDDEAAFNAALKDHIENNVAYDCRYRLKCKDETFRWFRARGASTRDESGQPLRMSGSIRDIHTNKIAEDALATAELRLQNAMDGGEVAIWDWNVVTNDLYVSAQLTARLGESETWTTSDDWLAHLHPDDKESAWDITEKYLSGETEHYEDTFRLRHIDGSYRWILARGQVFRDASGNPERMMGVHLDVTERREADELTQLMFNAAASGLMLVGQNGRIEQVNPALLAIAGYREDELVGQDVEILVPQKTRETHSSLRQEFWQNPSAREMNPNREVSLVRQNGEERFVEISLNSVQTSREFFVLVSIMDVTERREAESLLQRQAKILAASNAELEQFAYVASHDLQEPLRAIAGYVQLLEMDYEDSFDEVAREYMTHTVAGVVRMQALISDLLEYSRVTRQTEPFQSIELASCVETACALLALQIRESDAIIEAENLPHVLADSSQMTRLFQNLISNSIKYRSEATPHITIKVEEDTLAECWRIRVQDNGIGIEPKYAERIFVIFQRLHTREEYPGTGLGLAVCRRIVERHGGSIKIEPGNSTGTMFVFTIPFEPDSDGSMIGISFDGEQR